MAAQRNTIYELREEKKLVNQIPLKQNIIKISIFLCLIRKTLTNEVMQKWIIRLFSSHILYFLTLVFVYSVL